MKLAVGCGHENWGDVRLDYRFKYVISNTPNVIADATFLSFRPLSFTQVRASHVIEHLVDPETALRGLADVCREKLIIRFPVSSDPIKGAIKALLAGDILTTVLDTLARLRREHKWEISPQWVTRTLNQMGFAVKITTRPHEFFPVRIIPYELRALLNSIIRLLPWGRWAYSHEFIIESWRN